MSKGKSTRQSAAAFLSQCVLFLFLSSPLFCLILLDFFLSLYLGFSIGKVSLMFLCFHCDIDFRIIPLQILKQSPVLLACLGRCLLLVLRRWGLLHCRLSDRDNAELSTGHGDIGRKEGPSLANLLGTSPPFIACPPGPLQISQCGSVAAEPCMLCESFILVCAMHVNSLFPSCHYLC